MLSACLARRGLTGRVGDRRIAAGRLQVRLLRLLSERLFACLVRQADALPDHVSGLWSLQDGACSRLPAPVRRGWRPPTGRSHRSRSAQTPPDFRSFRSGHPAQRSSRWRYADAVGQRVLAVGCASPACQPAISDAGAEDLPALRPPSSSESRPSVGVIIRQAARANGSIGVARYDPVSRRRNHGRDGPYWRTHAIRDHGTALAPTTRTSTLGMRAAEVAGRRACDREARRSRCERACWPARRRLCCSWNDAGPVWPKAGCRSGWSL